MQLWCIHVPSCPLFSRDVVQLLTVKVSVSCSAPSALLSTLPVWCSGLLWPPLPLPDACLWALWYYYLDHAEAKVRKCLENQNLDLFQVRKLLIAQSTVWFHLLLQGYFLTQGIQALNVDALQNERILDSIKFWIQFSPTLTLTPG